MIQFEGNTFNFLFIHVERYISLSAFKFEYAELCHILAPDI